MNIVTIYGYFITVDGVNIVLELATGSVASLIYTNQPATEIQNFLVQVTQGLNQRYKNALVFRNHRKDRI